MQTYLVNANGTKVVTGTSAVKASNPAVAAHRFLGQLGTRRVQYPRGTFYNANAPIKLAVGERVTLTIERVK